MISRDYENHESTVISTTSEEDGVNSVISLYHSSCVSFDEYLCNYEQTFGS